MTVDSAGSLIIAGQVFIPTDFDPGPGVAIMGEGPYGTFIVKLNNVGNFVWGIQFIGDDRPPARVMSLATDANRNLYVSGDFQFATVYHPGGSFTIEGTEYFPWDPDEFNCGDVGPNCNSHDVFTFKFTEAGSLVWRRTYGGRASDFVGLRRYTDDLSE
jgi:hypothetical protein